MKILSKEQILDLHTYLIETSGGSDGVRDDGLLDSALNAPFHNFDGVEFFPSVQAKVARLCYGLISNHPFVDGNKRIKAHAMLADTRFIDSNYKLFYEYKLTKVDTLYILMIKGLMKWLSRFKNGEIAVLSAYQSKF